MVRPPGSPTLVLALDSGSPLTSVAVARDGEVIAQDAHQRASSSQSLLAAIAAVLGVAGAAPGDLDALCVLAGPGSFTGLRIGLATVLGLHQALGTRAAAMPTLHVLAQAHLGSAERVIAVVDAMRGEWFAQPFRRGRAQEDLLEEDGPPRIVRPEALATLGAGVLIGFGAERLAWDHDLAQFDAFESPPLAAVAARLAAAWPTWDPALLTRPLYLRPAPTTVSSPR